MFTSWERYATEFYTDHKILTVKVDDIEFANWIKWNPADAGEAFDLGNKTTAAVFRNLIHFLV